MEQLFDLLFSNFIVVAAIIGGLISFWNSMSNKDKEKEPAKVPARPKQATQQIPSSEKSNKRQIETYYEVKDRYQSEGGASYETTSQELHRAPMERFTPEDGQPLPVNPPVSIKGISNSKKWNKKRLAEGIWMSEILGRPRAYKPHHSHPRKR